MTQLIAVCAIRRAPANESPTELVGYDEKGEPIVKARSEEIRPGDFFTEENDVERQWFLDNGAARVPTATETEFYKFQSR